MLIAINGVIIDTVTIYKIEPVRLHRLYYDGKVEAESLETSHIIYFNVVLFGTNEGITTEIDIYNMDLPQKRVQLKKLQLFRQRIVDAWNQQKSTIPQLNLD